MRSFTGASPPGASTESSLSLHVLRKESDLLPLHEPIPQFLDGWKLHLLPVFTVNVQEDAEEHQEAAPDVPETRRRVGDVRPRVARQEAEGTF